ncbi:hypothetical protein BofuT4_uP002770.1 [Botrytis cinerea T4]|uniref:Uncharacterized protein n=1 Tax=Botryotinia fuckeliana (strain T4) TaxID=999810 RepID=G2Y378_BOTF4|nr:hypothetical protein BofuT4_uP002770.1 [Botrytis cinerea T4]
MDASTPYVPEEFKNQEIEQKTSKERCVLYCYNRETLLQPPIRAMKHHPLDPTSS